MDLGTVKVVRSEDRPRPTQARYRDLEPFAGGVKVDFEPSAFGGDPASKNCDPVVAHARQTFKYALDTGSAFEFDSNRAGFFGTIHDPHLLSRIGWSKARATPLE